MGEVVDFNTGEVIKVGRVPKRKDTANLIESLYQRRHQIGDVIIIYNDKLHGHIGFGMACKEDLDRRILYSFLEDYMRLYSDAGFSEDDE
jgi:hypothetical protein